MHASSRDTQVHEPLAPGEGTSAETSWPPTVDELRALFDARAGTTIALEEDLLVLDPETLEPAPSTDVPLDLGDDGRSGGHSRHGWVHVRTAVSGNAVAAGISLAEARLRLGERLEGIVALASAGAHPLASVAADVTDGQTGRLDSDDRAALATRRCGRLHVHVAVPGADRALAVFNAARSFLPELTALAANSPFVRGRDTGLASAGNAVGEARHRIGAPPSFAGWEDVVEFLAWGHESRLLADADDAWWDLRLHPRYGTLELRGTDAQTRVEDAAAVAAVYQCLLATLVDRYDAREPLPVHDTARVAENLWRAARDGTHGSLVDLDTGDTEETRVRITRLLQRLEPAAERLGTDWALLSAAALLADNGADRQRYVAARADVRELVRWLAAETISSAHEYLERRA